MTEPVQERGVRIVDFEEAMRADVVISTTGRVGLITKEMIKPGQIIFALSNPVPEISAEEALAAGAILPPWPASDRRLIPSLSQASHVAL